LFVYLFLYSTLLRRPRSTLFPYTTLFRSSLLIVLAIFGLLQLTSGGLFFNALKHDKENFTVLQTIRQQQSTLNGSWVALLQTRKDRKSTRLNSSHVKISYAVFCLKKKNK